MTLFENVLSFGKMILPIRGVMDGLSAYANDKSKSENSEAKIPNKKRFFIAPKIKST